MVRYDMHVLEVGRLACVFVGGAGVMILNDVGVLLRARYAFNFFILNSSADDGKGKSRSIFSS